jgi:hypothetical protein
MNFHVLSATISGCAADEWLHFFNFSAILGEWFAWENALIPKKMKKIQLLLLLAVLAIGVSSCKYEEGPFISFIPKVERVSNTWVVDQAVVNGVSSTSISGFKEITFFKEGACQIIYTALTLEYAYGGTWAFDDEKAGIVINTTDDLTHLLSYGNTWTILHLKEDVLKVSYSQSNLTGGTDSYVVTFKPKV